MDQYTSRLFKIESGGNPFAVTGSNMGLGQFGPDEWSQFGGGADWRDPNAQAAAVGRERMAYAPVLSKALGRDPTDAEFYLTHQQGIAGGPALLTADPNMPAWQAIRPYYKSDAIAQKAIGGNLPKDSGLSWDAPVSSFVNYWKNKFNNGNGVQMADNSMPPAAQAALARSGGAPAAPATGPYGDHPILGGLSNGLQNMGAWAIAGAQPMAGSMLLNSVLQRQKGFAPEWKQIGTDSLGQPQFGFVNPYSQTVNGRLPGTAGAMGSSGNGLADAIDTALKSGKTGEDLLKDVDPGIASIVRGISAGAQPYNPSTLMRTPQGRAALALLDQYEPGTTPADYAGRAAGMKDWAGGKSNELDRRAGQAIQHAGTGTDAFAALNNTPIKLWNTIKNTLSDQFGGSAPNNARMDVTSLANEMGAFVRGNGGSDASFKEWAQNFPINGSPDQQRGAMGEFAKLYEESMNELDQKRLRAIGPVQAAKLGPIMSPDATAALAKVKAYANGSGQPPQQFREGQTITNPNTGERRIYKGGQWVPLQ